ncbi:Ca-activated chloride channel family protein [Herbihabitans rhizosphaerae]|uniref:Ca-activated chloride channel family protein n=1 Tax=Herbihabitans rhizosphaerae TaxID=1872711 RepID=A0A4Q7L3G1_9PSEU|nr:VWA domain-containing protein [Herbihabitans rhizosphaerae]RZS43270.1 Ca-activated chloride channel family protein [Herbihabitans rhizosphaerae]
MFGFSFEGFSAPVWFLLLIAVLALVVGYVVVQRIRRRRTMRFTNLELLEKVAPKRQSWLRHVPALLLVISLMLLTTAMAGPTAEQKVPRNRATVMLVIDVSLSMEATDVRPSRIAAAKVAAKSFVDGLTPGINLGLISFAGTASVLVAPTTDRKSVAQSIETLRLAESTATGEAMFAALQSVEGFSQIMGGAQGPPPARVVLMTDGKQTVPTDPDHPRGAFTAARAAAERKIPVSTISFGTPHGSVTINGETQPVSVDDDSMREIAKVSGGEFYKAASAEELRKVYDTLGEQIGYELKDADASRPWLALGVLVLLISAGGSLLIGQRLP